MSRKSRLSLRLPLVTADYDMALGQLALALGQGPEGHRIKDVGIITAVLRRLAKIVDTVIYPGQDETDRTRLVRVFHDARSLMGRIEDKIHKVDRQ
jgi:hypothetical protein